MKRIFIYFLCLFFLSCSKKQALEEKYPPLFSFVISYDGPDNATSMAHIIESPAGKHGFIRVEDGHFVNEAGPIRFHATNLTGPANFPTHEVADKLASRLARLGINCVRHHFMDTWYTNFMPEPVQGILTYDTTTQRNLDSKQLDKLDYLIAALKKHGIYSDLNLHVGRTLDKRDGFENTEKLPWANKGVNHFEPRMVELQKEYALKLLTHVNLYTGNAYTDEPSVAMIEISNENTLINFYYNGTLDQLPEPYFSELNHQWNYWIHKKYISSESLQSAWNWDAETDKLTLSNGTKSGNLTLAFTEETIPSVKKDDSFCQQASRDFILFLENVEHLYWTGMYDYVKHDLKAKPLVSGTQLGYVPPHIMEELDYIDIHAYWRHPQGGWKSLTATEPWTIENDAMVNTMANIKDRLAIQRVYNKPYTISEYNHPYPNQYGAEGQPMLCIYGRLQGWDGVFQYSYNHYVDDFEPQANPWCFFDCIARTDVLAHFPACAAIFIRGDVSEAKESVVAAVELNSYQDSLIKNKTVNFSLSSLGIDNRLSMIHKTSLDYSGKGIAPSDIPKLPADQKIFTSDTKEITWNTERPKAAYLAVNTPNTKFFTGFPEGRTINLGSVQLEIGHTRLNWATVSLVSRFGTGFGEEGSPANILLAATGESGNAGRIVQPMGDDKITLSDRGGAPVMVEGIPAIIIISSDHEKTKCYALDPHGDRKAEVPVEEANNGKSKIMLKAEYKTIWYEINISKED